MLSTELESMDMYLSLGLLARVAKHCERGDDGTCDFGALRESTFLLPEKLVGLLKELHAAKYITCAENSNGNPYGVMRLTASGRELVATFGDELSEFVANAPARFRVSVSERSMRRIGKRECDNIVRL